jgi:hypothetical protein
MFYNKVIEHLQAYLVKRDTGSLNAALAVLEAERDNPSLSATTITLNMPGAEVENKISTEGSLKVRLGEGMQVDGDLQEGKFVRVFASDQPEDTCLILNITFMQDKVVVLVPIMPL